MSARQFELLHIPVDDKACWTIPILDGRNRPIPWAAFGDYSAPVLAHFADDDTDAFTISSEDTGLCSIPEDVDDDLTGSSCYSRHSWPIDENLTEDIGQLEEEEPEEAEEDFGGPREVCHSFFFRGAQYETVRTIVRANSESAFSGLYSSDSDSDAWSSSSTSLSLSGDVPDDVSDPGTDTPQLSRSPTPDPLDAVRCGVELIAARQHLEEDLYYREHEWLLQQIGCGRMEIWVTEERVERTELSEDSRPRVFFAPPSGRRQSLGGCS
ncbi:uncharacterized protein C8Q71DRAFT_188437 [Rhodofomes roseus]|uniref:Uncharacterized protein n=1 Tax=Rhodofomes roseus TaxID=34475 RepID=A0ABQ8K8D3_9APHY|nr:uncharacterized protein C8Q71DRAFT_188437 [Rhodofomes roseus]KAH9833529.1 hypothetical protein C8Q71DRAFT_188437 [Rhodofomes roseus]